MELSLKLNRVFCVFRNIQIRESRNVNDAKEKQKQRNAQKKEEIRNN